MRTLNVVVNGFGIPLYIKYSNLNGIRIKKVKKLLKGGQT